jgi:transposase
MRERTLLRPSDRVILDNLAVKKAAVRAAVTARGARLLVFRPDPPDLNLIEQALRQAQSPAPCR